MQVQGEREHGQDHGGHVAQGHLPLRRAAGTPGPLRQAEGPAPAHKGIPNYTQTPKFHSPTQGNPKRAPNCKHSPTHPLDLKPAPRLPRCTNPLQGPQTCIQTPNIHLSIPRTVNLHGRPQRSTHSLKGAPNLHPDLKAEPIPETLRLYSLPVLQHPRDPPASAHPHPPTPRSPLAPVSHSPLSLGHIEGGGPVGTRARGKWGGDMGLRWRPLRD